MTYYRVPLRPTHRDPGQHPDTLRGDHRRSTMPKKKKNPKNPALETISEESGSPPSGTSSEDDIADPTSAAPGPKGPKEIQGSATSAPEGAKSPEGVKSHTGTNFPEGEQLRDETRSQGGAKFRKETQSPEGELSSEEEFSQIGLKSPKGAQSRESTKSPEGDQHLDREKTLARAKPSEERKVSGR